MTEVGPQSYRIRLRARFEKSFSSEEKEMHVKFSGRELKVSPQKLGQVLDDAKWLIFAAGGFENEISASRFGKSLGQALLFAGLCSRIGIDIGEDKPTSMISEDFARAIGIIRAEERLFQNIHGLIVVPDDGNNRFHYAEITATIRSDPGQFFQTLGEIGQSAEAESRAISNGIFLLNSAMLSVHPLAQTVLALSAIEAIGQNEKWSASQKSLISRLGDCAESDSECEPLQSREVAKAIRSGLHKVSLRQGVLRVLDRIGLPNLKPEWNSMYILRSRIFHGLERPSDQKMSELAQDSLRLSGKIILKFAKNEGMNIPEVATANFGEI